MGDFSLTSALISVFDKNGLEPIIDELTRRNVSLYSTGGTFEYIVSRGIPVTAVEDITHFPSVFGGRVKTLHPSIFGGILYRRGFTEDLKEKEKYQIPSIDLIIVDLYPFEETVARGGTWEECIEKIDIGGISLIRAAAKNHTDVAIVSSRKQYSTFLDWLVNDKLTLRNRKHLAIEAFKISSRYDSAIHNYLSNEDDSSFSRTWSNSKTLRYGENPHQSGTFYGELDEMFTQLHGKELSYNNLVDIDSAVQLMSEFDDIPTCGILKHNNACGFAQSDTLVEAYSKALAADPISAFGGVIITNKYVDIATAGLLNDLFFEILIAPEFQPEALELLKSKKNRILLHQNQKWQESWSVKTVLNGVLVQQYDKTTESERDLRVVTNASPTLSQKLDLLFATRICKHTKSNAIVIVKNGQLLASGTGQTSRVDALEQAISKALKFGFDLKGSVLASDAFFPFADCVEISHKAGISSILQPGGSIRDQESIDYCNSAGLSMVFTGLRHFKH